MTFEEAVEILQDLGGGHLLSGLHHVADELENADDNQDALVNVTHREWMAYFILIKRMRPLFA